ncbi:hypothetical protein, partial [Mesorhizobium sp. M7A.F.Ca.CA.001.12.1.1]|uniref:hypothetical protein n=1 Tax=Mesorhizobium sp. M7A.F.Ca.CA.001.12.1.1 TaxID=2496724 RepID=UPI0019CFB990
ACAAPAAAIPPAAAAISAGAVGHGGAPGQAGQEAAREGGRTQQAALRDDGNSCQGQAPQISTDAVVHVPGGIAPETKGGYR